MQHEDHKVSRRKLVGWLGVVSLFTIIGGAFSRSKKLKNKTVRMLTQDGKLVEVDAPLLVENVKKISDKDLRNWVKR